MEGSGGITYVESNVSKIKENLQEIIEELKNINKNSEYDFISIGDELNSISGQAEILSKMSLQCSEMLMGEKTTNVIYDLRNKFKNLDSYFKYSIHKIDEDKELLDKVMDDFKMIDSPFETFKKIVKQLNLLSVSIRIESARLTSDNKTFEVLANDVLKLANNAENILKEITGLIDIVYKNMESLFIEIFQLKEDKYIKTREKIVPINDVLKDLWDEQSRYAHISQNISEIMKENRSDISNIVFSLQAHDIIRQKIEHIIEAFEEMIHNFELNEPGQEELSKLAVLFSLQIDQLADAENNIIFAVNDIKNKIGSLYGNSINLGDEISSISHLIKNKSSKILKDSESQVNEIKNSILQTSK